MQITVSGKVSGHYVLYAGFVRGKVAVTEFASNELPLTMEIPSPSQPSLFWVWVYVWDRSGDSHQHGIRRIGLAHWTHKSIAIQDLETTSGDSVGMQVVCSSDIMANISKDVLSLQRDLAVAGKDMLGTSVKEWRGNHGDMATVFKDFQGVAPWACSVMYFPNGVGSQHNWFHLASVRAGINLASHTVFTTIYDCWKRYPTGNQSDPCLIWSLSHVITLACAVLPYMFDPTLKDDPTRPFAFDDTQYHFYDCEDLTALAMYIWGVLVRHSDDLGPRYRRVIGQYDIFMATMTLETSPGTLGYHAVPLLIHRSCCHAWGLGESMDCDPKMPLVLVLEGTELLETTIQVPPGAILSEKPSEYPLCPSMFHQRWPMAEKANGCIGNYRHVVSLMPLTPSSNVVEFAMCDKTGVAVPMAKVVKGDRTIHARPTHRMTADERALLIKGASELLPCVSSTAGLVSHEEKAQKHSMGDDSVYTYWVRKIDLDNGGEDWLDMLDELKVDYRVDVAPFSPGLSAVYIDKATADKLDPTVLANALVKWSSVREKPTFPRIHY